MSRKEYLNRNWSLSSLNDLLKNTDQTNTVDRKPGRGKTCKTCTAQNVDAVEVFNQENASGTHRMSSKTRRTV